MQPGKTEHSHDRVADVFFQRPAVALQGGPHGGEVDVENLAERLAVELLAEVGGALQVSEEDRDDPSGFLRWV